MLILRRHRQFVKEYNKIKLSDQHYSKYIQYLSKVISKEQLPLESKDHSLKGEYLDCREFHVSGDVLVVYRVEENIVQLLRIGSHSQVFKN